AATTSRTTPKNMANFLLMVGLNSRRDKASSSMAHCPPGIHPSRHEAGEIQFIRTHQSTPVSRFDLAGHASAASKLVQLGARSWPGRTAIHENGADACDRAVTGGDR